MAWLNAERDMPSSAARRAEAAVGAPPPARRPVRSVQMTSLSCFLHQVMRNYTPYRANDSALSSGSSTVLRERVPCTSSTRSISTAASSHRTGTELFDLHNPATAQVIGRVRLADEEDAHPHCCRCRLARLPGLLAHEQGRTHRPAAADARRYEGASGGTAGSNRRRVWRARLACRLHG